MAKSPNPYRLLVEGAQDKRLIPELLEANGIAWEDDSSHWNYFVDIQSHGGINELLAPDVLAAELDIVGLKAIGIIVDADENAKDRWQQLLNCCKKHFKEMPTELPEEGLIYQKSEDEVRLGIWLMPDNQASGMMETFLKHLVPDKADTLFGFAKDSCKKAKELGAPYKEVHADKALIHTWLAWQDEPGNQMHVAVKKKIFAAKSAYAQNFIDWFNRLYPRPQSNNT